MATPAWKAGHGASGPKAFTGAGGRVRDAPRQQLGESKKAKAAAG